MITKLKLIASAFFLALTFVKPQLVLASFEDLPADIRKMVLKNVALDAIIKNKSFGDIAPVSSQWAEDLRTAVNEDLQPWQPIWKHYFGVTDQNEDVFRKFLNGVLEYRENPDDVNPTLTFSFSSVMSLSSNRTFDLSKCVLKKDLDDVDPKNSFSFFNLLNPFSYSVFDFSEKTFDLSKCRDRSEHILITTSADEFLKFNEQNKKKIIVLVCPYTEIKGHHEAYFPEIKDQSWNPKVAPIAVFWRDGFLSDRQFHDSLVTASIKEISKDKLIDNFYNFEHMGSWMLKGYIQGQIKVMDCFKFHF